MLYDEGFQFFLNLQKSRTKRPFGGLYQPVSRSLDSAADAINNSPPDSFEAGVDA
jgi:hypothetical protein